VPLGDVGAIVDGARVKGDGGGGNFYYDTANNNVTNPTTVSGTVIVPTARIGLTGAWIRIFSGPVNILWSGAGHGNAAQDTAAIQGTINETATLAGTTSREIYFPLVPTGYLIDTPILVQGALGKQALRLTGELPGGPGSIGVIWHYTGAATNSALLHCLGTNGFKMSNISLDGAFATKFVLLFESDQPNNIGCSDTVLENVMLQSARNVAGAAHLCLGNAAFGTGNTQCDDLRAYNLTIIGDPNDVNYLADGVLNRVGNNTKGHWYYGMFINTCRYGMNLVAGGSPGGFYGGGISVCFRAAFLLGSLPFYVRDVDFEGNNSFVSSAGQGDAQSSLVFEDCQVTDGHLWHIEAGWDVDLEYVGGPLTFNGGFLSNSRFLAIVDASNTTPINVQLTPLPGQGGDHQLQTGDFVQITGVAGNLAANAGWTITRVSATHITLDGSVGSGAYTGGGSLQPEPQIIVGDQITGSTTASFESDGTIWPATSNLNGPRVKDPNGLELRDPAISQANDIRYRVKSGSGSVIGAADFRMPDIDTRNQRDKAGILLSATTQNLTNANATIDVSTGKNQYVAQPRLYTANRTLTLGTTSAVANSTIIVVREDTEAFTLTVINGGPAAGTLSVLPASTAGTWIYSFDGVDWFELVNQVNLS
jgi:hypothetical protein